LLIMTQDLHVVALKYKLKPIVAAPYRDPAPVAIS